jgi:hypothetical protein
MMRKLSSDFWNPLTNSNTPLHRFKQTEIQTVINSLSPKTSPGYDLITGKILQELPPVGIKYITQLLNAFLLLGYFPN